VRGADRAGPSAAATAARKCGVYVSKLPIGTNNMQLANLFAHVAPVVSATVHLDVNGAPKGWGYVSSLTVQFLPLSLHAILFVFYTVLLCFLRVNPGYVLLSVSSVVKFALPEHAKIAVASMNGYMPAPGAVPLQVTIDRK
jgi:hypothetical protein